MDYKNFILNKYFDNNNEVYSLNIINGTQWGFRSLPSLSKWLDDLARIMQFNNSSPEKVNKFLTFIEKGSDYLTTEIKDGWNKLKQGSAFCIWSHDYFDEIIIELNPKFLDHPEIKIIFMWSAIKQILRYYVFYSIGPMHSGCANLNGQGFLIAAPGGVGKSTSMRRLPTNYEVLCDDISLIIKAKNNYYIHPMPTWSDHLVGNSYTTFKTSKAIPLNAIFFLHQSNRDFITKLHKTEAIQFINNSFLQCWESYMNRIEKKDKKNMSERLFENAYSLAGSVPCYLLETTLQGKFWINIEKELKKQNVYRPLYNTCVGPSMIPTIRSGDAYLLEKINKVEELRVGDVIVFYDNERDKNIVHRIVKKESNGVITRGDNNSKPDPYIVEFKNIQGIVKKIVRGNKEIFVKGGFLGILRHKCIIFLRYIKPFFKKPIKAIYHNLAKTKLLYCFHNFFKIEIIQVKKGNLFQSIALYKGKPIGKKIGSGNDWEFVAPYKLFINPRKLL